MTSYMYTTSPHVLLQPLPWRGKTYVCHKQSACRVWATAPSQGRFPGERPAWVLSVQRVMLRVGSVASRASRGPPMAQTVFSTDKRPLLVHLASERVVSLGRVHFSSYLVQTTIHPSPESCLHFRLTSLVFLLFEAEARGQLRSVLNAHSNWRAECWHGIIGESDSWVTAQGRAVVQSCLANPGPQSWPLHAARNQHLHRWQRRKVGRWRNRLYGEPPHLSTPLPQALGKILHFPSFNRGLILVVSPFMERKGRVYYWYP